MPIITITNETGCGEVMYKTVATTLKYKLINREMMTYAGKIMGLDPKHLETLDEKNFSKINTIINNFFDIKIFSPHNLEEAENKPSEKYEYDTLSHSGENYKYATEKLIYMMANEGNVIIVGRGANFILKNYKDTLNVFISADYEQRVKNISKSMDLSEKDALKHAKDTDLKKRKYIKYYFDEEIDNPHNYHIMINLSKICEENAAAMICNIINNRYFK